jgi:hypothetical protein
MKKPTERPEYSIPDRHTDGGKGTTREGVPVHGTYKQPWVERDGVTDPTGEGKIG